MLKFHFSLCAAQLKFWFQIDLGRVNSASYYRQGRQLLLLLLIMVTRWSRSTTNFYALVGQRWVHTENLCSILNLVYFDSRSWQSFASTCDVFNCLFPLDIQNEIQLLSGVFCYSWRVCLVGFCIGNSMICSDTWHKYHEWYFEWFLHIISRAVRRVKFKTILKYHEWYLCQISRTNHAIICLYYYPQNVCNFHMLVFQIKLKYHCSKPIKLH